MTVSICSLLRLSSDYSFGYIKLNTIRAALSADCKAGFSGLSWSTVPNKNRLKAIAIDMKE